MRRFILGWKTLGHTQRFCAETVVYADDVCVLGKAPAAETLTAVKRLMDGLKLTVNEQKTRCLRCPEEAFEFLGYRIGRSYRPTGKGSYIGTRPSKASVQSICREISDATARRHAGQAPEVVVERLNWTNSWTCGFDTRIRACSTTSRAAPPPICVHVSRGRRREASDSSARPRA